MNRQEADDVVIAYVRGEPMDNDDRVSLERDLPTSTRLQELVEEQRLLSADFAAIREGYDNLRPSAAQEASLLQAFRAKNSRPRKRSRPSVLWLNVAGLWAVAIGLISWGVLRLDWKSDTGQLSAVSETVMPSSASDPFVQLPYGLTMDPSQGYTVVRARLGRMGLRNAGIALSAPLRAGPVDVDLLLGDDGMVVGIRFVDPGLPRSGSPIEASLQEDQI